MFKSTECIDNFLNESDVAKVRYRRNRRGNDQISETVVLSIAVVCKNSNCQIKV